MVTGGAEAPITRMSVAGFCANTAFQQILIQKRQAGHLIKIAMALLLVKVQELSFWKS